MKDNFEMEKDVRTAYINAYNTLMTTAKSKSLTELLSYELFKMGYRKYVKLKVVQMTDK